MKIINVFIVTATVCIAGYIIHLFISPGYPFSDYTQIPNIHPQHKNQNTNHRTIQFGHNKKKTPKPHFLTQKK